MMNQKLTLSIDPAMIMQAKRHAKRYNTSVSRMTQEFFASLPKDHKTSQREKMTGIIPSDDTTKGIYKNKLETHK